MTPKFGLPQEKEVTLTRPLFVSGKGLPKGGVCLASAGTTLTIKTDNGADWYMPGYYRRKDLKIAVIPSAL